MKMKQLQVLKDQHKRYVGMISNPKVDEPDAGCHIVHALVRGENPPLQTVAVISNKAREAVVNCRYSSERTLKLSDVFQVPASYRKAEREFQAASEKSTKALAKYQKEAELLLRKARLNDGLEPEEVSVELRLIAIRHGIDA